MLEGDSITIVQSRENKSLEEELCSSDGKGLTLLMLYKANVICEVQG